MGRKETYRDSGQTVQHIVGGARVRTAARRIGREGEERDVGRGRHGALKRGAGVRHCCWCGVKVVVFKPGWGGLAVLGKWRVRELDCLVNWSWMMELGIRPCHTLYIPLHPAASPLSLCTTRTRCISLQVDHRIDHTTGPDISRGCTRRVSKPLKHTHAV